MYFLSTDKLLNRHEAMPYSETTMHIHGGTVKAGVHLAVKALRRSGGKNFLSNNVQLKKTKNLLSVIAVTKEYTFFFFP